MKYLIIRCEDRAQAGEQVPSLLEGSKVAHLAQLSQSGCAGLIQGKKRADESCSGIDRLQIHRGLLGLTLENQHALPGACYAAQGGIKIDDGKTAWCCEFVTAHDNKIIDPVGGKISSKESTMLVETLNEQLGSDTRRWVALQDSHSLFLTSDLLFLADGKPPIQPPEMLVGNPWGAQLSKGQPGQALQLLIEQATKILEDHPVNRVRVDLGENPANLIWFWGAARFDSLSSKNKSPVQKGLIISSRFPMKGLSALLGYELSGNEIALDEDGCQQLSRSIKEAIERYDLVYVNLTIDSSDSIERLCIMERIDQTLLKPLTMSLSRHDSIRFLFAADDRLNGLVSFVATGSGLPRLEANRMTTKQLMDGSLSFEDSAALFSWFTQTPS